MELNVISCNVSLTKPHAYTACVLKRMHLKLEHAQKKNIFLTLYTSTQQQNNELP